jgi:hypothetical protein
LLKGVSIRSTQGGDGREPVRKLVEIAFDLSKFV